MPYGHYIKKSRQSLRPSEGVSDEIFFQKLAQREKIPNFEIAWPAMPRALTVKGDFEVTQNKFELNWNHVNEYK